MSEDETFAPADDEGEALLVARAKQREPSAWAELYDAHYSKLYRYCYARTGDEATAADLASKVFLEALEGIDRYEFRGRPLLAWLYRIARNVLTDHLRARERESKALEQAASLSDRHDPGPDAHVADREDLLAAMKQLTEEQQQVVALRYFAGCSTPEIARLMRRSERAVYSLEARALASLRRLLEPEQAESAA
ncbi:MAG: RNA polymerase sigma factor [Dehalococcoidia bacterium]